MITISVKCETCGNMLEGIVREDAVPFMGQVIVAEITTASQKHGWTTTKEATGNVRYQCAECAEKGREKG